MAHSTVRATILPEIIKLICANQNVTEREALDMFYSSATGSSFADDDSDFTVNHRFIFTDCLRKKLNRYG